jgi:ankyrin repeat protein
MKKRTTVTESTSSEEQKLTTEANSSNEDSSLPREERYTALHIAAETGNKEECEKILKTTPLAIDEVTEDGKTALHLAAENGNTEICKLLMSKMTSDNIKMQDTNGETALDYAKEAGFEDIIGAIQFKLLTSAIELGRLDEARELINQMKPQALGQVNEENKTALHLAAEKEHASIVELLLSKDGVDVNAQDEYNTALHDAAAKGHKEIVELLLSKDGVDVNAQNKYKYTALHKAASKGHKEIVTILLEHKAEVDSFHPYSSPLELAVLRNQPEVIKILLSYGANPNALDPSGLSALHLAAEKGNKQILELLLNNKGKADIVSEAGDSLVHSAAIGYREGNGKCLDLIKWLLENYEDLVNPFLENNNGKEPRDILEMKDWSYAEQLDNLLGELGYYITEVA